MDLRLSRESHLPFDVTLPDGTRVTVRRIRPTDQRMLRAWFRGLSPESRYKRFRAPVSDLSDAQWRYLTRVDGIDHVALVALIEDRLVAVARLIVRPGEAELAFLVGDEVQRRGIGSVLRDALLAIAYARGARRLCAHVMPDSVAIRRLLAVPTVHLIADRGDVLELVLAGS